MPIDSFQREILKLLASSRNPESFVAGGVPINRAGPRYSKDIDIFLDRMERVSEAADRDAATLQASGYTVLWSRRLPTIVGAEITKDGNKTKLEWVADSDFRFFPAVPDPELGYVLSIVDLAVNKLMAAVGRREPRDIVDLLTLHSGYIRLGTTAWAAVEVAPGFTPEGILAELRRNSRYSAADYRMLDASPPIDPDDVARRVRLMIDEAERFVASMPSDKAGRIFLLNGRVVEPDPARLMTYVEHLPHWSEHWPVSPEIERAMLERYLTGTSPPSANESRGGCE
ncbi:MAG: nucleotidyl transferase AbiEii/AbiGii toxin family protein [Hyphomicrobiaceae bacterium]